ncbi:MAG: molecular chaperone TorD family protein [Helicobacteraceae bacterium]|nr:molecular chaperone TorD family protein [Helicobacteraceae bacterium]
MLKKKQDSQNNQKKAINNARILYYDFFAGLFLYDLLINRKDLLLEQIKILKTQPLNDGDLIFFEALENEIKANGIKNILFEYTRFFMLPFDTNANTSTNKSDKKEKNNCQIILYLSYYLDGTIAGSGLIKAKEKIRKSKVRLNEKEFKENEEHIGFLFVFSKYLLQNNEDSLQSEVFKDCIMPMKDKIIENIKNKYLDSIYYNIANIMESFLDFEMAFNIKS